MQKEYQMEILENLEKFPVDTDKSVQEYQEKIAERIEVHRQIRDLSHAQRMHVHKVVPFIVNEAVYYEIILTPAYDTTSKFDRFVCYSSILVPSHYSIKADIYYEDIQVQDKRMPGRVVYHNDLEESLIVNASKVIDLIYQMYLKAKIGYKHDVRVEEYPFAREAIREAVYNAIAHRLWKAFHNLWEKECMSSISTV